jgi:hypothetical protein
MPHLGIRDHLGTAGEGSPHFCQLAYTLTASAFVALLAELWVPTSVILFEILMGQWRVGR